jgi:cytochrome c oxidase cbb3-type subunit III
VGVDFHSHRCLGVGYWVAYPAWPGIQSPRRDAGLFLARQCRHRDLGVRGPQRAFFVQLLETDLDEIRENDELHRFAVNAGASVFRAQCSQCHGTGGAGVQASGFPNLLDDDWLWGGTMDDIVTTVTWGIRNEDYADARYSAMPAFGQDGLLRAEEIDQVVNHVLSCRGGS